MEALTCWLRLQLTPGLGRAGLIRLIAEYGSPQAALAAAGHWQRLAGRFRELAAAVPTAADPRLDRLQQRLARCDAWLLTFWDDDYPLLLKNIPDPPAVLFGRGQRRFGEALAVVGSRAPSATGVMVAETLAQAVASRGVTIVSGLARGIDAAAHRGALAAGGTTIAVLGCGIDRIYPPEHARMFDEIAERGTLLSEYLPGSDPLSSHFPGRNRIISGLSRGILVIEATLDSGSLITAELALEQGREVFAVPGSIDRPTSAGPNRLIKEGAHPVTECADVLTMLWPEACARRPPIEDCRSSPTLEEPARSVWMALAGQPRHVDELSGELGLTAGELSAILLHLELLGGVEQLPGARFARTRHWSTDR